MCVYKRYNYILEGLPTQTLSQSLQLVQEQIFNVHL